MYAAQPSLACSSCVANCEAMASKVQDRAVAPDPPQYYGRHYATQHEQLSTPEPSMLFICSNRPTEVLLCAGHSYLRSRQGSCRRQDGRYCEHSAVRLQSRAPGAAVGCGAGVPDCPTRCLAPCLGRTHSQLGGPKSSKQPTFSQGPRACKQQFS